MLTIVSVKLVEESSGPYAAAAREPSSLQRIPGEARRDVMQEGKKSLRCKMQNMALQTQNKDSAPVRCHKSCCISEKVWGWFAEV